MKYKIEKKDEDTSILKYKNKEYEITKDIEVIKDFQDVNNKARRKMVFDLSKEGTSIKNLTIEMKQNGKTIYDNSNAKELERIYIEEQSQLLFNNLCNRYFGMDFVSLFEDIGIETEAEAEQMSLDLIEAFTGRDVKTPSNK